MSVLYESEIGWFISHESYINDLYKCVNHNGDLKSFSFDRNLFKINVPFKNEKNLKRKVEENSSDFPMIERNFIKLVEELQTQSFLEVAKEDDTNDLAQETAKVFLNKKSDLKFFKGGNKNSECLVTCFQNEHFIIPNCCEFYCYNIQDIKKYLDEKFDLILLDPPWWNKYIRRKKTKNSIEGYNMLYNEDIASIPISSMLTDDGLVIVWCTNSPSIIEFVLNKIFPAWDVKFLAQWFWVKVTKCGKTVCPFSSSNGKQPYERLLFASKREIPIPQSKLILSVPSAIHSHKPPLIELLEKYLPVRQKCLELFARYLQPNFTSYGNEVLKLQNLCLYEDNKPETSSDNCNS